ncbi:RNA-binding protein [Oceanobacillus sp. J11TS1]|uniref:YlmH family RNA-binding protein n=1 Tax=Oceanobacillus sp. J11TS1 TaxID=2807191 RepID=UPI001B011AE9|nr:YlmH/Sll1252 family protein [Oceanobacillus sp. J11TS1]GIO21891.1 RNA-binding protein S4 [Oceanobacillus sp. J11TS1]
MEVYQHFRKEEQPFIDQVLSWKEQVERTYIPKLTDFLDPREQEVVRMLLGTSQDDLQVEAFGGSEYSERKRIVIAPIYDTITEDMFQVELLEAAYPEKFMKVEHRDVMGAFLSQGVKRKKLGDIMIAGGKIHLLAAKEVVPYIKLNLTSIKKSRISFTEQSLQSLMVKEESWKAYDKTISSLRLDTVIKEIYGLSRKDAATFIQKQLVKVNYRVVDDVKFQMQEGDMLSVRGKGRSKIVEIRGRTKKDKIKMTAAMLQ